MGGGLYDSNIDIIAHTAANGVYEEIIYIICRNDRSDISSHHDIILSQFSLLCQPPPPKQSDLLDAPRTVYTRSKILWTEEGILQYQSLVANQLKDLRSRWLLGTSRQPHQYFS